MAATRTPKDQAFRERLQKLDQLASQIAKSTGNLFELAQTQTQGQFKPRATYIRVRGLGHDLYQQLRNHVHIQECLYDTDHKTYKYADVLRISPIVIAFLETLKQDSGIANLCFQRSKITFTSGQYPYNLSAVLHSPEPDAKAVQASQTRRGTPDTGYSSLSGLTPDQQQERACQSLNALVDTLRSTFKDPQFQSRLKNFRRRAKENYQGLIDFATKLCDHYQHIAVVYVRFEYEVSDHSKNRDIYADRQALVSLKSPIRKTSIGYALKIEYMDPKPILHGMLFYRASDTHRLVHDLFEIYNYWYEQATSHSGQRPNPTTFNRRYIEARHQRPLPEEIQSIATMITKFDNYAQSKGKGRTFTKSTLPRTVKPSTPVLSSSTSMFQSG
ncbi:hypothetical protein [Allochromatium vinosum]|uniref:hypothetical protein n=1 Tax=Allochromatium vinosum TaxID=1049 RepID=UPI0011D13EF0|nr:hypothetical protein [Allochromatium vinosum]